ncbi:hypothetical protein BH09PLA1_BH09PLA1_12530 [soil metagenome]
MSLRIALLALLLAPIGCAPRENIPTYPNMPPADSLGQIERRSSVIGDISGEGAIVLIDPKGQSVRLDAAFVFAPPDRARVRAWKFGQAVLDLIVTGDGSWLYLPRQDKHADQLRSASTDTGRAVREWLALLAGGFDPKQDAVRESESQWIVTRPMAHDATLLAMIDRPTLTPRRYVMRDDRGRERFTLTLSQYRAVGETVWPMRIEAKSDSGLVQIDMRSVELNSAPSSAFKPPSRAERLP